MKSASKIIMNTAFLYGKIVITIFLSLYSTRLILNSLGEVDYGIFNLIGGVIAMLSFINGSMVIATQRYLSISLGARDMEKLKSVFRSSLILHLIISLIIVILLEIGGLFLFHGALNIPIERVNTAKVIFHFMVISTFFTINAVPYDASINTHENMLYDSLIGILMSIFKLGIAIFLIYTNFDKLILYGLLIAILTIVERIIKRAYCIMKYEECRTQAASKIDIPMVREMISFAGWNLFGYFCSVLKSQGLAILLNSFFGILINAAYGVSNQVNSNIKQFSSNMVRAIMPQITKSEGGGDRQRMLRLSVMASKISFFLLAIFAVPVIIEMTFILKLWLKTVPENAAIFCQLTLITSMMYQITVGTMSAVTSVGNIKKFQIAVGTIEIFTLPFAWFLMKMGLPAHFVLINSIFFEFIAGNMRVWYAHKIAGLNIKDFLIKTTLASAATVAIAFTFGYLLTLLLPPSLTRAAGVFFVTSVLLVLGGRYIALTKEEYFQIKDILAVLLKEIKKALKQIFQKAQSPLGANSIQERLGYPRNTKLLIIHADDFGFTASENKATIEALESGMINSGSIMVPCKGFAEASEYARNHPGSDLGIHLTLTCEWDHYKWGPALSPSDVESLVDEQGFFLKNKESLNSRSRPDHVENELRAQILVAQKSGVDPTHLDSHMFISTANNEILDICIRLSKEFKIPLLLTKNLPFRYLLRRDLIFIDNLLYAGPENHNNLPDFYTNSLRTLKPGLNCLLVHVAFNDEEMQNITAGQPFFGSEWRQSDFDFFTGSECRKLLDDNNIQLITWRQIRDKLIIGN